ncbi:uncharacterized protein FOMMEDRAFT_19422, partial [Fomitiporia mediterranea MF3/22]|uniref:uncharacterized protein n=1 Tax=Fomitiporia mediterranea (strain MF3/22) TaxID=694068 RepID=UPI000440941D
MSNTIIEEGDPSLMFTQGSLPAEDSQFSYGTREDLSTVPLSLQYDTYTYKPRLPYRSLDSVTLEGQAKKEVVVCSELLIKDAVANMNNSKALLAASKALFEAFKESTYKMSKAIKESAYEAECQREKLDVLLSELDTVKLHVEYSISLLKPERSDFLNIDFDKVKRDKALNLEMVLKKKSIVVKGNQEEVNTTKLTFSEFTSCFLQAYDCTKDLFKVTKEEFVPHKLLPNMTVEECSTGLEGMIRAHKQFIIEFCEEVVRSKKQKGLDEGYTHREGSNTSSNNMSKRYCLFSPLKKAWNRLKVTEKKKDVKTKFSKQTVIQFLVDKLKAFKEAQVRYITIGCATTVLLNNNLLKLCVNTDREFCVIMNQYIHSKKSINADIKKAVKNPNTQYKHNDSCFKRAPITIRDDRTMSAQPNPSCMSLPSSGQSQAISAGNQYSQPSAHLLQTIQQPVVGGNQYCSETIQVSAMYNLPTCGSYASQVGLSSRLSSKALQGS